MYIYGDIVLAVNFIMNSLILLLTAHIAGIEFRWRRIGTAALLGSLYALGEIEPQLVFLYIIPIKMVVAAVIMYLAFGYKTAKSFGLISVIFFIVSFILAGAIFGWIYFLDSNPLEMSRIKSSLTVDFTALAAGFSLAVILIFLAGKWIAGQMFRQRNSYLFTLRYKKKGFNGRGFVDTGNGLYSQIGRNPVILLTKEAAMKILPLRAAAYLERYGQNEWLDNLSECPDKEWLSRIEIIPYMTVGSADSSRLLLAFRPDNISIFTSEGEIVSSKAVVAITDTIFSKHDNYSALLHPALIKEVNLKKEETGVCALPGQQ